ncbi:MAG: MarR family transcriptional regulator [Chelatococcus sp.]|uniref:MarR family winged helix-turn-helix transcriptional regulator n=1 Tax=unclassified Chelatococcus TaxID=2638111 RepID=UPI001BCE0404|nr:MarR family transcriptional regulator [Chelatococcus sp.]MBS7739272.1 MarR family transcriptional regulator [Chelatococcus sp. HY11]CAH1669925.1 MarR family transcriptional regulator [Hyphomicrobiales bacterium]MBX3539773.1 MarR family transcriptional regulator [Chelatococcus sp.]MBX3546551.1 MarR family transcriptional regulator [Chelatococcus sp.]MCO5076195.1 MarR family transcriptional regulator [Chelatococcus sp.]
MSTTDVEPWIDAETKVAEAPADHRAELRLWLRLLTCTTLIENEIRRKLRDDFDFTLPRFDLLAQLEKAEDGLVLGEVSKRLMVSAGNVTAIVERLLASGHVTRTALPQDRRTQIVRMTEEGRSTFKAMADEHGEWIGRMFDDLDPAEIDQLMNLLGKLKTSVRAGIKRGEEQ